MIEFLASFDPIIQTLIGTGFTWMMTALGAATAFFGKNLSRKLLDWMLGFAVMMTLGVAFR